MDTNSKTIQESKTREEQNLDKFLNTIDNLRKFKRIIFLLIAIGLIAMIIIMPNKKLGAVISLFVLMMILYAKRLMQDFKDIGIFQEIYEITNTTEDVVEILERTNEDKGIETLLGKNHKGIKNNLYKVGKLMYSSIIKGKQSENLANELVVDVSKNLKSPVENINIYIQALENSNGKIYKSNLNKLEEESNQLKHNIEELFELAKAMTRSIDLDIQSIDIKNLTRQALVEYEDKLSNNNLKLVTDIQNKKALINADGQQMWRVFEILLDNIVKYSKENSRVYLDILSKNNEVVISLINISKDELNIDIESFYENIRQNNEKNKIGLAIAKNLISIQDGTMDIVIDGDMFKVEMKFKEIIEIEE